MVLWLKGFFLPIAELVIIGGVILIISFYVGRGLYRLWTQKYRWVWKYKILRKPYDERTMKWCVEAIEKGMDYFDVKKLLFVNNNKKRMIYETLYIYLQISKFMVKGGEKNGRINERNNRKVESSALPEI